MQKGGVGGDETHKGHVDGLDFLNRVEVKTKKKGLIASGKGGFYHLCIEQGGGEMKLVRRNGTLREEIIPNRKFDYKSAL